MDLFTLLVEDAADLGERGTLNSKTSSAIKPRKNARCRLARVVATATLGKETTRMSFWPSQLLIGKIGRSTD